MSRPVLIGAVIVGLMFLMGDYARSADAVRPSVGGVESLPDAMIFYVAKGPTGACGKDCSEWIAAEGTVQWDTHRRLIAILDRLSGRKLPVILTVRGQGNFNVAVALGKILRERGFDVSAGTTLVDRSTCNTEAACFALKRQGGPLDAKVDMSGVRCDVACVLILAGGIHRSLPPTAKVILTGMQIHNRLGLNVSDERRGGLTTLYGDRLRFYLTQMGVNAELMNIIEENSARGRVTELSSDNWTRFGIVNVSTP